MKLRLLIITLFLNLLACSPKPEPIDYGNDICEFCKMNITDSKYAAEIVTHKNKIYKFDSIECLFQFRKSFIKEEEIHSEWVNDFSQPGKLIDLKNAYFLKSEVYRSPMGLNVLSVESKEKLNEIKAKDGGNEMSYTEVFVLANEK
ncbi:Nitrous oxide reductase accessory protein NosL [Ignavibacterium album JCM 16511]|uniref:Nitrous oxide reductase accessory protein NosL n=1 Tax=Ignavibacterium album (strain DSM 19864 / JCM 16511 / NBRC 101810 / Mat9-16) TaxID=945713 RepID=I0AHV6_IGNAJ|nr:nitrous oxide reductase accessory protein NosL [Ignavibacterium album]AFH48563.1 Nitrous oxide reductase accessory protein NosL [Ignavibacterium album JCM 16511]